MSLTIKQNACCSFSIVKRAKKIIQVGPGGARASLPGAPSLYPRLTAAGPAPGGPSTFPPVRAKTLNQAPQHSKSSWMMLPTLGGAPKPPPVRAKTMNQAPQLFKLNDATVSVQVSRCLMEQCRIVCWMCTEVEREGRESERVDVHGLLQGELFASLDFFSRERERVLQCFTEKEEEDFESFTVFYGEVCPFFEEEEDDDEKFKQTFLMAQVCFAGWPSDRQLTIGSSAHHRFAGSPSDLSAKVRFAV